MVELFFIKRFILNTLIPYMVLGLSIGYLLFELIASKESKENFYLYNDKLYFSLIKRPIKKIILFCIDSKNNIKKSRNIKKETKKKKKIERKNKKNLLKKEKSKKKLNKKINKMNKKVDKKKQKKKSKKK